MSNFVQVCKTLQQEPKFFLITGVAGFIGSNLLEALLKLNQHVVGLDNFSTGSSKNLQIVKNSVTSKQWNCFKFIEGDIRSLEHCRTACKDVDYVLHQAALGSVPRSLAEPITTNETNVSGFLNILMASKESGVESFTYAASSSTYGDHPDLPKVENHIGKPLSPYAVTKYVNELYAEVFALSYGFNSIGLRYFNVFGKHQDPGGAYAAVIPKWTSAMIQNKKIFINGNGKTSRDFCYIDNVIQANILAATTIQGNKNEVYNIALGKRTSLNKLFEYLRDALKENKIDYSLQPEYRDFREGDVLHSQANITKAQNKLGYAPKYQILDGIKNAMPWYVETLGKK